MQEGLSPNHLKKAKLMFFYTRYPSSNMLKTYFSDVKVGAAFIFPLFRCLWVQQWSRLLGVNGNECGVNFRWRLGCEWLAILVLSSKGAKQKYHLSIKTWGCFPSHMRDQCSPGDFASVFTCFSGFLDEISLGNVWMFQGKKNPLFLQQ